ncbi:6,7-dimethyl-8-ribityllumazine synthase [candidate division WOR-3 bacterium]|nr:6,7-dimethyl-8-ribityllumazine synthase [candidate division WOR-3 bacterium]
MKIYEGSISGEGKKFGIIVSRFNGFVTERLLDGALDCLKRHGADLNAVEIFKVPGAFEIPQILNILSQDDSRFDALICLGAVIRGETPHFDFLSREVSRGIARVSHESKLPVGFGLITADTPEQAIERAGSKLGNKGFDAALSVMEQLGIINKISEGKKKKGTRTRP